MKAAACSRPQAQHINRDTLGNTQQPVASPTNHIEQSSTLHKRPLTEADVPLKLRFSARFQINMRKMSFFIFYFFLLFSCGACPLNRLNPSFAGIKIELIRSSSGYIRIHREKLCTFDPPMMRYENRDDSDDNDQFHLMCMQAGGLLACLLVGVCFWLFFGCLA
jgi:hypothetical protein